MDNRKLEKILDEMKAKGGSPTEEFMQLLKASYVVSPALVPRNTNPEIMRELLNHPGEEMQIPDGIRPQPCILQSAEGENLLAIFTSEAEMKKNKQAPKFPLTMRVAFEDCVKLIRQSKEIAGAVINPFTHNVIFRVEENKPKQETIQVTMEEFHILTRQKMESFYLPKTLFDKKEEAVERLRDEQGEYLKELYEDLYDTEVACPYVPEDFEIMNLNISDELFLIRIAMPDKYAVDKTCPCVIVGWNGKEQTIRYFAIVLGEGNKAFLYELKNGGTAVNLGEAPSEGSELTTVIDIINAE